MTGKIPKKNKARRVGSVVDLPVIVELVDSKGEMIGFGGARDVVELVADGRK
jgi:PII-like signaling protein